jgi:hypothetical protein
MVFAMGDILQKRQILSMEYKSGSLLNFVENTVVPERSLLEKWVLIEGKRASISEAVVAWVSRSEHYSVLRCCSAAVMRSGKGERGLRLEDGGRK